MRTSEYVLDEKEIIRLCNGTQASKLEWTHETRGLVAIDGDTVHELIEQASPFDLWGSVRKS